MPKYVPLEVPESPQLAQNIVHFSRSLRRAGLPVGTGRVIDAIKAVNEAGFSEKKDFYWMYIKRSIIYFNLTEVIT